MIAPYCIKNPIDFHPLLAEIPQPAEKLWICGDLPDNSKKFVCIVGSRSCTRYGLDAVDKIISELDPSIYVVSGMAIGIDTAVHTACLKYGIKTIAFPGSGLDRSVLYPQSNISLAEKIVSAGGCIISEYEHTARSLPWMFIKRNRLMAGISQVTIVVEAQEKSGTLVTARMAIDYNREVGAVPGSIFSKSSEGSNRLIHDGATPIRSATDIHTLLGLHTQTSLPFIKTYEDCDENEIKIIRSLEFLGTTTREDLIAHAELHIILFNTVLTLLEIKGYILCTHNSVSLTR
jgi:DNA processing protein